MLKNKIIIKPLFKSFKYAGKGILKNLRTGRSFKLQLIIFAMALIAGFVLHISRIEWLIMLLTGSLVLSLEMINTSLELAIDLVTEEYKVISEHAKDIAAGAVLVSSIIAFVIGLIIFIPYIIKLF